MSPSSPSPDEPGALGRTRFSPAYVYAGFGCLLLSAYFDSIRGPLLPPMARELDLQFTDSGWFFAVGYAAALVVTVALNAVLNRHSERRVVLAVCGTGLAAALVAPLVAGTPLLLTLAALGGATVSVFGTMANVLVLEGSPTRLQGRMLSGLHAFYGIGSMFAAATVGWSLRRNYHWSSLYTSAIPALALVAAFAWLRMGTQPTGATKTVQSARLTGRQAGVVATFAVYVLGEVTMATWLVTYLVQVSGMPAADAASYLTGNYFAMTIARVLCFLFLKPAYERLILVLALILALLAFGIGYVGYPWAFAAMGVYGAFFPVFLARMSRTHPQKWRAITIWSVIAMNALIGLGNLGLGRVADALGMRRAYLVPPTMLALALLMLLCQLWRERHLPPESGVKTA